MAPKPRSTKAAPSRRAEILDTAQRLFIAKGFQNTSVEDIIAEIGIAKGTLYYHFSSKDEILRAIIGRTTQRAASAARAVAEGPGGAIGKFAAVVAASRVDQPERELAEELHASGNAQFHILTIVEMVRALAPVLTDVVEQGIVEGVFSAPHPRETVEILLTSAGMLLDEGIFTGDHDELARRTRGLVHAAETLLGCEPGTFASMASGGPQPIPHTDAEAPQCCSDS